MFQMNSLSRFGGKDCNIFDNHSGILTKFLCPKYHTVFEISIYEINIIFLTLDIYVQHKTGVECNTYVIRAC